jgi:hypothetical protein
MISTELLGNLLKTLGTLMPAPTPLQLLQDAAHLAEKFLTI